jgi:CheY-like chemotaxis protein
MPMKPKQVDVLIIEDQQFDAELISRALYSQAADLTTAIAPTGAAAIEYLQTHSPKAILLDLHLSDMDGCEVLRQIRGHSRTRTIPVLVITGADVDRHRSETHRLGISGYIQKTADLGVLADHLVLFKHLLAKSKLAPAS